MKQPTNLPKQRRGFSLIEVLVSIFIFAIIMTATANIFGHTVKSYRYARASQAALEDAQFAMNRIAKSLRTSSVQSVGPGGQSIIIYDYSRSGGACVRYRITGNAITEEVKQLNYNTDDILNCNSSAFTGVAPATLTTHDVQGAFVATASDYDQKHAGRVSMVFVVKDVHNGAPVYLQTTVSLRDYDVSGLM